MKRIGVIGSGRLGQCLLDMLKGHGISDISVPNRNIMASLRRDNSYLKGKYNFVDFHRDNTHIAKNSDAIIISVKPNDVEIVCREIGDCLDPKVPIISTAAVVPLNKLRGWLPKSKTVIRTIPNIACSIGCGIVPYFANSNNRYTDDIVADIFDPNIIIPVYSDAEMDAATIISACGPAFFAWFSDIISSAGIGLSISARNQMIRQTMMGTVAMLKQHKHEEIIRMVSSPKGITESIFTDLKNNSCEMKDVFENSYSNIRELSQKFNNLSE